MCLKERNLFVYKQISF